MVPVAATVWVLWWLFTRLDGILGQALTPMVGRSVPGLGLLVLIIALISIGWLAERALGRRVTQLWESLVVRVPVARPVYRASRRMLLSVLGTESRSFQRAVLCEYPTPGTWSIAFVTGDVPVDLAEEVGHEGVTVFLPTAPNPMSGFLVVVPPEKIRPLDVPVEAAFTFVVSMGAVAMDGETGSLEVRSAAPKEKG